MRALGIVVALALAAPAWADEAAPVDGKQLYSHKCQGCHGADGKADTKQGHKYKIADFTDRKWSKSWDRAHVRKTIEDGVQGEMPPWKDKLSAEEIDAIAGYVFVLAGKPNHK